MKILIVCSANMCRSPMAEVLLSQLARQRGVDLQVSSAGTMGIAGAPCVENTWVMAREHGLSLDYFFSTALSHELILASDVILVMEEHHRRSVLELAAGQQPQVHLLGSFHPQGGPNFQIEDPVGMDLSVFRACFHFLRVCLDGFLDRLVEAQQRAGSES